MKQSALDQAKNILQQLKTKMGPPPEVDLSQYQSPRVQAAAQQSWPLISNAQQAYRYGDPLSAIQNYPQEVQQRKQYPFFNSGHPVGMWFKELVADTKKRGLIQGAQDVSNPIIMNPYIYPVGERLTSNARVAINQRGLQKTVPFNLFQ